MHVRFIMCQCYEMLPMLFIMCACYEHSGMARCLQHLKRELLTELERECQERYAVLPPT